MIEVYNLHQVIKEKLDRFPEIKNCTVLIESYQISLFKINGSKFYIKTAIGKKQIKNWNTFLMEFNLKETTLHELETELRYIFNRFQETNRNKDLDIILRKNKISFMSYKKKIKQ